MSDKFNQDCEDCDFLQKHNKNHLRDITKRLKNPEKRAEHNKQQLDAITDRLKDPEKRYQHNTCQSNRLKDHDVREKHNKHVLERYRTNREEFSSIILSYFSQISQGPTLGHFTFTLLCNFG